MWLNIMHLVVLKYFMLFIFCNSRIGIKGNEWHAIHNYTCLSTTNYISHSELLQLNYCAEFCLSFEDKFMKNCLHLMKLYLIWPLFFVVNRFIITWHQHLISLIICLFVWLDIHEQTLFYHPFTDTQSYQCPNSFWPWTTFPSNQDISISL